jgi:outer membrane biosynthesis protein TonB
MIEPINEELPVEVTPEDVVEETAPVVVEEAVKEPAPKAVKEEKVKHAKEKHVNKDKAKKVALFSSKNLHIEAESLKQGFNIVNEDKADKWLKHKAVRLANPEEVASAYGK